MASNARRLAIASYLGAASQIASVAVGVLVMPFMVHRLGDHLYGLWSLVAVFVGYYGLLDLGLSSAISRYVAAAIGTNDTEECNRIFNTALRLFVYLGACVILVSIIVASASGLLFKIAQDREIFRLSVLVLGLNFAIGLPLRVFIGALNANLRYDITQTVDLLGLILRTSLVVVALLLGYKVIALAWVTFVASLPVFCIYIFLAFRELPFLRIRRSLWHRDTAKKLFSYSTYSFITQVSDIFRFQMDAVIIGAFLTIADVTHYRIAGSMAQYFLGFMLAIMGAFRTVFSRQEGSGDFSLIRKTLMFGTKISVCVSSFIAFGLVAWGKPFIGRWMGVNYLDAYPCLVALVVGYLFALWQQPSIGLMFGISKHRFLAGLSIAEGIANLLLSVLLVRHLGILGVALGTAIPLFISKILIQPLYVCSIANINAVDYYALLGTAVTLAAVSLVLPLLITIYIARSTYESLALTACLSLAAYAVPLFYLAFSFDERKFLLRATWRPRVAA